MAAPGRIDYSKFDHIAESDSQDEAQGDSAFQAETTELLSELPPELDDGLSLALSASSGRVNVVEALLDRAAPVDSRDQHGATALLRAVDGGIPNRPVITLLLRRGARVDICSDSGESPLTAAASSGPPELLEALLEFSSPSSEATGLALAAAARAGNRDTSKALAWRSPAADVFFKGRLALGAWAERGDLQMMELLVSLRGDVNALDEKGFRPLMFAVRGGFDTCVHWLCERNASVSECSEDGSNALTLAAERRPELSSLALMRALLDHSGARSSLPTSTPPALTTPLVNAATWGHVSVVRLLLEARAAAADADSFGRRPLVCAAATGSEEMCHFLLDADCDVSARGTSGPSKGDDGDTLGVTALSITTASGNLALTKLLLAARADPELTDERGSTPLMTAARVGADVLCSELLIAGASLDKLQEGTLKTALIFAASAGHVATCRLLLTQGASTAASTNVGATALHAAAANGHAEVCVVLVDAKASLETLGPGGSRAADLAAAAGHTEVEQVLQAKERETKNM